MAWNYFRNDQGCFRERINYVNDEVVHSGQIERIDCATFPGRETPGQVQGPFGGTPRPVKRAARIADDAPAGTEGIPMGTIVLTPMEVMRDNLPMIGGIVAIIGLVAVYYFATRKKGTAKK